ncbi:thioredoxin domain-containing protein 5 homolog [Diaphorina citri]|uniref:Thioredoxin domain-containing protein 5 homolog n=1 Tax=Diaphorina citri TaxID=121845 RepID=A0A1S3DB21_DIACI|nr:thioredoxin domain-containing protein 5 homolog [Diaphorina citri]KAI5711993.1 hypothetical protein M8J75_004856 [Diaphorina citri]KAI5754331.1 hypothetical protein M8J77_007810 [Diaphorina citri]
MFSQFKKIIKPLGVLALLHFVKCDSSGSMTEGKSKVLTQNTFSEEVPKNNYFIMFYAPWCGHCKNLHPIWEELADMLNDSEDSRVTIGQVDCTVEKQLCADQEITGYPTLKFFKKGSESEASKFRGTRDLPTLTNFINEQISETPKEPSDKPIVNEGLVELTEESFEKYVSLGNHFVKFYAPWCGHCQSLAPVWQELASHFKTEEDVSIAKIDCTQHRSICQSFDIKSYPTLLWIESGKKLDKFQGSRTLETLVNYVSKMKGPLNKKADSPDAENASEVPVKPEPVVSLTSENFNDVIKSGTVFIKFFAPWCGHCKRLAPTWEELGTKLLDNKHGIVIAKVDCTQELSKDLCNQEGVDGFPSIYVYKNGVRTAEYNGSRDLEELYQFILKHKVESHDEL